MSEREPEGLFRDAGAPRARRLAALTEPVVIRKIWPGRSRSAAIAVTLNMRDNQNIVQIEIRRIDGTSRFYPSAPAIQLSIARLPELVEALLAGHRLGSIDRRGVDP
jgi:hypothetical protein